MAIIVYKPGKGTVRIRPKPDILDACSKFEFSKYRKTGVPASQVPREVTDDVINYVLSKDFEELFYYEFLKDFSYNPPKKTMARIVCDDCGEPTTKITLKYLMVRNCARVAMKLKEIRGENMNSIF